MLNNKILFSPIGDTDPIRDYYDGAMLHIVRYYNPQKIYLYFSEEMMKNEEENQIYSRAIKSLQPDTVIEKFPKSAIELVKDAHKFDLFYKIFYNIIEKIKMENENCEILLNMSSGTPAMKSTMMLLSITLNDKNIKLIQVPTPDKNSNRNKPHIDVKANDVEDEVKYSFDTEGFNKPGMNRCIEQNLIETKKVFILNNVKNMLAKSDYSGLNDLVRENADILSETTCNYVYHMYNRYVGNAGIAQEFARKLDYDLLYPIKNIDTLRLTEKFNIIKVKRLRGEVQDWLVLIYNVIQKLYEQILISKNIDKNIFVDIKGRIDKVKFKNNYPDLYSEFTDGELNNRFTDLHYARIIECFDEKFVVDNIYFKQIKEFRNDVAHKLNFVEKCKIESEIKMTLKDFENIVKNYIYEYRINTSTECLTKALNVYSDVDKIILKCFQDEIKK